MNQYQMFDERPDSGGIVNTMRKLVVEGYNMDGNITNDIRKLFILIGS